jgi:hypothetical protein
MHIFIKKIIVLCVKVTTCVDNGGSTTDGDNGTTSKIGNDYDDEERAKGFKRNKIYKQNSRT